jgi:8-oxo-dGTP pyrophosphatase MutT (NUDIX family)
LAKWRSFQASSLQLKLLRATLCAALVLLLQACTAATPGCSIVAGEAHVVEGNAGCLVERNREMLVVRHLMSGKLGMPAGYGEPGESAQCTAHRETWEEAGLAVRVGELLWEDPKNDFFLFACRLADKRSVSPGSDAAEIAAVLWLDPHGIEPSQWRFPDQWPHVMEAFERLSARNAR